MVATGVISALAIADRAPLAALVAAPVKRMLVDWQRNEHRWRWRLGLELPGTPDLARLDERMRAAGVSWGAPVLVRIFKEESQLELWMAKGDRFVLFATYPVCRWSGGLGPKLRQGDGQSPEGFYTVARNQLNPRSRWHRSFNLGFPNIYDRGLGRTGSFIMVHGGCSSVGCFAITNEAVNEVWRLVTSALSAGQPRFQVQVFPFRMTEANLALHAGSRWQEFWNDLKVGHDLFEASHRPVATSVCEGRYRFESQSGMASAALERRCPVRTALGGR